MAGSPAFGTVLYDSHFQFTVTRSPTVYTSLTGDTVTSTLVSDGGIGNVGTIWLTHLDVHVSSVACAVGAVATTAPTTASEPATAVAAARNDLRGCMSHSLIR
jgi:hypothetical protein